LALAESYYRDALAIAKQMSTQASEMELQGKLGDVYIVIGDSMQAASFYKRQLIISRDLGSRETGKKALVGIGESYEMWGDPTRAIDYFEKYLAISRKEKDWLAVTDMLYVLGERYRKIKQLVPSYHAFEEYVALMDKAGNQEAVVDGLNQMGNVSRDGSSNKNAIDLYKKALDVARANGDLVGESWTLGNMSIAYNLMGKQWQATRFGERSLSTASKSRKKAPLARAHYRVALVAYRQEKWEKALESGQIALSLYTSMDDQAMVEKCQRLLDTVQKSNKKTGLFS
jgi:tetratricopeptide (TPR) repeat protein